ncbi:MAG: Hsp20/alpha crystallin family protein [Deltaproteobacteria bacterium]|nr:Hsp20/alpha crystallin family protein [Deltaproteobacteria bacterium]
MSRKRDETFDILFSMKNKMDRFFSGAESGPVSFTQQPVLHWSPSVDLFDCGDEYRLMVEVPGIEKEEIDLAVYADKVVIKGSRDDDYDVGGVHAVLCMERVCGRFERVILLPDPVDAERVRAVLKNGVLTVLLTKQLVEVGKKSIVIK